MRTCVYIFGGVLMLEYDAKGVLLTIDAIETYGQEKGSFGVSDPLAGCAGQTRGSAGINSRVVLAQPASRPVSRGYRLDPARGISITSWHDRTRPVSFENVLTRPVRSEKLLTRPDPTSVRVGK